MTENTKITLNTYPLAASPP